MKTIVIRSLIISLVVSTVSALIGFLIEPVEIQEGEVFELQLTLILFQAFVIFVPVFIGCFSYGIWEAKTKN